MIIVTGGAGFIGSNLVKALNSRGHNDILIVDDLTDGTKFVNLVGLDYADYLDKDDFLARIKAGDNFGKVEALFHQGACSTTTEWDGKYMMATNYEYSKVLLQFCCSRFIPFIYASSAATYGEPKQVPILESAPTKPTNPYGATKLAIDQMITAESAAKGIAAASLRYFNVAGALKSKRGWLAERHNPETHLIPNVLRSTKENPVKIFGTDWPTADGTCVRDYVHVVDLIDAHIKALETLTAGVHEIYNLGSGDGYSVREVVAAASKAAGHQIPTIDSPRRAGDPAVLIADINKAKTKLGWSPTRGIDVMVADTLAALS